MSADETVTVTSAEFHRNIGTYHDLALTRAVTYRRAAKAAR